MKKIPLSGKRGEGKFALVDDEDYEYLSQFKWNLSSEGYVIRHQMVNGKKIFILMHREIVDAPEGMDVDHIDGNRLNNQRSNLRIATRSQNNMNMRPRKGSSKYKGVSWYKRYGKWEAYIRKDGKQQRIGYFDSEIEAAYAYNEKAKELFGEFARLNPIPEDFVPPKKEKKYRGVHFDKARNKWRASIYHKGKKYELGRFDFEIEAAKAYNAKALELLGDKAKLNIIPEEEESTK